MKLSGAGHLDEEQQGSQDCPLGASGRNWSWSRRLTFSHNLLAFVGTEAFFPTPRGILQFHNDAARLRGVDD